MKWKLLLTGEIGGVIPGLNLPWVTANVNLAHHEVLWTKGGAPRNGTVNKKPNNPYSEDFQTRLLDDPIPTNTYRISVPIFIFFIPCHLSPRYSGLFLLR